MSHASASPQGATGGSAVPPNPYKNKAIGLAVAAAVGGFLFGFDSSVINGAVDAIEGEFDIDPAVTGLVVAVALLGCAFGAWLGGKLADRWGRTRVMFLGAVLFFVSSILSGLAFGVWDLVLWRVWPASASASRRSSRRRTSPRSPRPPCAAGSGSLQQLAITLGIFAALLSDQLLADVGGRRVRGAVVRPRGVALDVHRRRDPGGRVRHPRAADPRVAALPHRDAASARRPRRSWPRRSAEGDDVEAHVVADRAHDRDRQEARVAGQPARARGSGCCRSSGSASCCRCSSSSSAST